MLYNQTIGLLIPTLNEEEGLRKVLEIIPSYIDRVLIIDGNSTDKTSHVAREFGADVVIEPRPGYGRAIRTGFNHVKEDWIVTLDADGTYPTSEIEFLMAYAIKNSISLVG